MKNLVLPIALAALTPSLLGAAEIGCPEGQRPLIELVATASSPLSPVGGRSSGGSLICTGGAVTQVTVSRDAFVTPGEGESLNELPDFVTVLTGTVPAPTLAALNQALVAARVGNVGDCHLSSLGLIDTADRITWHGRRGRRNTFTVTTDVLDVYLLVCPDEVETLVSSIYLALLEAGASEDASALVIH